MRQLKSTDIILICCLSFLPSCDEQSNTEQPELMIINTEQTDEASSENGSESDNDEEQQINLPISYFNYADIELPSYLNLPSGNNRFITIEHDNTPQNNPITNAGATLGRVLFYDTQLSLNQTVSCASCHRQEHGFTDQNRLSIGFEDGLTRRHSMSLTNARFYQSGKFFWDERADSLEQQVLMPIQDIVEMGLTLEQLELRIQQQSFYPALFSDAFGDNSINSELIAKALAQFIRSMVSTDTKYDRGRATANNSRADFDNFSVDENIGKSLFFNGKNGARACSGCHNGDAFIGNSIANDGVRSAATNNGLDIVSSEDLGIFESSNLNRDIGRFKVPSLKNIAVGAPFMHDGRFNTLEEVVEHYSSGIMPHMNLDNGLLDEQGEVINYDFTESEKISLVSFLNTLTDTTIITHEKYSNPFLQP
ncbi:cytochrome-c peroxidase [Thalassotalea crassostreae]|uniref:cytochrome-c peroxidase n=1 Tax=Thalassotalea crassostreae TaxID=1763536 RepID=UPI0009ED6C03|nr:cytochrome-c peroxidase [Thalassotalea crassostreae]